MKRKTVYRAIAWIAIVLLSLIIYGAVSGRLERLFTDQNAPYPRFAKSAVGFLMKTGSAFRERAALVRENAALAEQNAELLAKMPAYAVFEEENTRLREMLELSAKYPENIRAEVVSRDGIASGWLKTVRIDKGERDGVKRYAPVVNANGLVGRVFETSHRTADVLLLADPNSSVSCYVEREGIATHGVLTGSGFGSSQNSFVLTGIAKPLTVDFLDKDIEIRKGDKILTSGLGGLFPRGLPVGEVTDAAEAPSGLYKTARIAPYADFKTVSLVFVLQPAKNLAEDAE